MQRPWNRPSLPVYSLSTSDGKRHNMNFCTYVTAISMQPKRYIVGVYKNTFTLELLQQNPGCVLQLLSDKQSSIVRLLGKQSGFQINKIEKIKEQLTTIKGLYVLKNACAIMFCDVVQWIDAGDHYAVLCHIASYRNIHPSPPLTTDLLRKKKIISA